MTKPDQPRLAGGLFIALGALLGAIGGGIYSRLPFQGFLIGVSIGIAIAIAIWLYDRARR